MSTAVQTLAQFEKANHLINRSFRKNGPKSFKAGQGAIMNLLVADGRASRDQFIEATGYSRRALKDIVKKAERNEFVTIEDDEETTYNVVLTELGREIAEKRVAAQTEAAEGILSCLSAEEVAQLDAITEKLILAAKEQGIHGAKVTHQAKAMGWHHHRHPVH